jgi:ornithine carbamoyltransferase
MCHSYINAALRFDFSLAIACPPGHQPESGFVDAGAGRIELCDDAEAAAAQADLIVTDVWASMGQEEEQQQRLDTFAAYQVNRGVMNQANKDALFMHCLPAHRGEEVTGEVLDSPQSVVWQEAENRLHAQKSLLEALLAPSG